MQTQYFTLATAGHVDHGKTSVLRALTGIDPDRLKEEKLRQMTTDLGFAHLRFAPSSTDNKELVVGFIDVPGHGKFLKNMLAGVGGIDMALLVVAADEGPMPQTVRHVKILSLLGVTRTLVVLTKIDLADAERQEDAVRRIDAMLALYGIERAALVKVSCPGELGFDELRSTLRQVLSSSMSRGDEETLLPAFLPIDRVFSKSGYGVVVTGTLVRGAINVGDSVAIEPGGIKARVRGLETFGKQLQKAMAGQRLAVNLSLKEHKQLARGQNVLGAALPVCSTLVVSLNKVGDLRDERLEETLSGQKIRFYHGTAEASGFVRFVDVQAVAGDARALPIALINLSDAVVAEPGEKFVLRYGDDGIAGGAILLTARPRFLTRPKLLSLAQLAHAADWLGALKYFIENNPQKMVREDLITCFLPRSILRGVIEEALFSKQFFKWDHYLVTAGGRDDITAKLFAQLESLALSADSSQKEEGLEALRARVMPGLDRGAFQHLIRELCDAGSLVRKGDKVALPGDNSLPREDSQRQELSKKILDHLSQHICLEIDELARLCNIDRKTVTVVLHELSKKNEARIVNYDFASLASQIERAHEALERIWRQRRDISPSEFKESLGTTRKYAMALLSYFDDNQVTRRVNNSRVLLKAPRRDGAPG
jgi:selenocysteine-specific elongation factor